MGAETKKATDTLPGTQPLPWSFSSVSEWVHDVWDSDYPVTDKTPSWDAKYDSANSEYGHPDANVTCTTGHAEWWGGGSQRIPSGPAPRQ